MNELEKWGKEAVSLAIESKNIITEKGIRASLPAIKTSTVNRLQRLPGGKKVLKFLKIKDFKSQNASKEGPKPIADLNPSETCIGVMRKIVTETDNAKIRDMIHALAHNMKAPVSVVNLNSIKEFLEQLDKQTNSKNENVSSEKISATKQPIPPESALVHVPETTNTSSEIEQSGGLNQYSTEELNTRSSNLKSLLDNILQVNEAKILEGIVAILDTPETRKLAKMLYRLTIDTNFEKNIKRNELIQNFTQQIANRNSEGAAKVLSSFEILHPQWLAEKVPELSEEQEKAVSELITKLGNCLSFLNNKLSASNLGVRFPNYETKEGFEFLKELDELFVLATGQNDRKIDKLSTYFESKQDNNSRNAKILRLFAKTQLDRLEQEANQVATAQKPKSSNQNSTGGNSNQNSAGGNNSKTIKGPTGVLADNSKIPPIDISIRNESTLEEKNKMKEKLKNFPGSTFDINAREGQAIAAAFNKIMKVLRNKDLTNEQQQQKLSDMRRYLQDRLDRKEFNEEGRTVARETLKTLNILVDNSEK